MIERRGFLRGFLARLAAGFAAWHGVPELALASSGSENESNTKIWTTRDGREIRIVDMTDDHLRNTIFHLHQRLAQVLAFDLEWANATADPFAEAEYEQHKKAGPARLWPIYADLLREADRRGLSWRPR